ncbi:K02A2.6-like [Cordylochernes scorpioides]|uniref:RNA-directed DNA polymerase n=1 Tax=Cordylochernes scorpioides TaxID=51811 RepID=A0ABY6L2P0_9ARAC|nr:K02A2.6-like [Cordylochernes scorpioides]
MDIKNVRKWCREFNEGRINVHDEQRSGRPSLPESTVARIDEMVRANRRITLEEIEDGLNEDCSHFSVHKIVSETLGYRKVSARWVDKWLKEAVGEWYNPGITKLVDRMKKVIEHKGDYISIRNEASLEQNCFFVVVAVVSNEELQMSPYISITAVAMSTILDVKATALGPCQFSVVVMSNEEPQMSPCISITAVAMSTILDMKAAALDNIDLVTHDISFLNVTPLDHLIIEEETNKDPVLNKLKEYLLEDPQLAKKDETMKPFLSKLENFSVLQGCIFVDSRAVIPRTCQDQMLKLLHQSHIGINRMKSLARSSVWWPKMDSQIEEFVKECSPCMHHQTAPPAENTPWPRTNQPWQRVHVDHFYFRGDCYLLVVDANSNWIEVFPVRGTTSQENIKLLRECFARYGLPQCLVSDNGPPFNSIEFKEFLRKNNVYHLTSPAYNPSSNGIAEVSVRIIKKSLEKSLEESPNSNMDCILQNVLFNYRNTPTSLDKPPVERLLSYVPRTFVNCLNSEFIQKTFGRNECGRRHFQVGDKVLFTRVIQNRRKWFKAQVIR